MARGRKPTQAVGQLVQSSPPEIEFPSSGGKRTRKATEKKAAQDDTPKPGMQLFVGVQVTAV